MLRVCVGRRREGAEVCEGVLEGGCGSGGGGGRVWESGSVREGERGAGEGGCGVLCLGSWVWGCRGVSCCVCCCSCGRGRGFHWLDRYSVVVDIHSDFLVEETANSKFQEADYFSAKCLYSGALEMLERCCLHMRGADKTWEGLKNNMALCDLKRRGGRGLHGDLPL